MDDKLKDAIKELRNFQKEDWDLMRWKEVDEQLSFILDTLTRLYEVPRGLLKIEIQNLIEKYKPCQHNPLIQCDCPDWKPDLAQAFYDLITPQFNKLKSELEQARKEIEELEKTCFSIRQARIEDIDKLETELEQARDRIERLKHELISKEAELEAAKLKISELENTDNLRREQLEEARKFDCWKWLLSWLKSYDELNKTDVGDKIYQWIQEQPMTSS